MAELFGRSAAHCGRTAAQCGRMAELCGRTAAPCGRTVFRTPVSAKRVAGGGGSPPRSVRQTFPDWYQRWIQESTHKNKDRFGLAGSTPGRKHPERRVASPNRFIRTLKRPFLKWVRKRRGTKMIVRGALRLSYTYERLGMGQIWETIIIMNLTAPFST